MTLWTENQELLIEKYLKNEITPKKYWCEACGVFSEASICNTCGQPNLDLKCILYSKDSCKHTGYLIPQKCPICNELMCPECGGHNIQVVSRVTGYLSPVGNWSKGKQQELFDRTRHNISGMI
jgi:hypothetical protein